MDSGSGIRVDPIGAGAASRVNTGRRSPVNIGSENINSQGINIADINPETTEAIRAALKNAPIDILQKALRDADVQITQYTMDIVKSLINGSLPLTEENIIDLILQSHVFKEAQPDVLALMMRLEIPATPENIEQFEQLINNGEKLAQNLENLINRLPAEIFRSAGNLPELSFLLNEIIEMIKEQEQAPQPTRQQNNNNGPSVGRDAPGAPQNNNNVASVGRGIPDAPQNSNAAPNNINNNNQGARPVLTRGELNNLINLLRSLGVPNQILNRVININRQNAEFARTQAPSQNINNLNNSENNIRNINDTQPVQNTQANQAPQVRAENNNMLEIINRFVQDTAGRIPQESEFARTYLDNIKNMLESPAVQKLIKAEIQAKWVLTPQDLTGGSPQVSKYYNELNNNLHKFAQLLQILNPESAAPEPANARPSDLYAQARNVQNNLSLMNEISKTMPFLQLPIKFSNEKIINSDLYIFNNKKRKSASPVQSVNALIKLELENLGGLDIYINLAGRNARARFFTDKTEAAAEIERNLPELDEQIHALGFNFTSVSQTADEESEFDILDDFINREMPKTEIKKYILNKKI